MEGLSLSAKGHLWEGKRAVDSLLLLLGTHLGHITGGAQLMLMATTKQVAESYLSLTFRAVACCFSFPEGRRPRGALRGAGAGEGAADLGRESGRGGRAAGRAPERPHPETTCPGQEE